MGAMSFLYRSEEATVPSWPVIKSMKTDAEFAGGPVVLPAILAIKQPEAEAPGAGAKPSLMRMVKLSPIRGST